MHVGGDQKAATNCVFDLESVIAQKRILKNCFQASHVFKHDGMKPRARNLDEFVKGSAR
jgi:hypothetical protein